MEQMSHAVRTVLSKYATFQGRAPRSEFWWWVLALFLVLVVTQLIDGAVVAPLLGFDAFASEAGQPLSWLVSLGVILPNIAVGVRRLHDTGRSGWWILIGLIPLIGTLILLYFYIQPSEQAENAYGAAPA
ncbi:DUF805 domain-containing protein [Ruegeria arenilitoris]|uniref:DUF805 domain-containing protein n=1 Tax=Ruegeria arenilitoris TaxID=1173585 RepID=UPI00147A59AF|nr:DUF805 domain-containing protein [Ruegeria arenilitoris]